MPSGYRLRLRLLSRVLNCCYCCRLLLLLPPAAATARVLLLPPPELLLDGHLSKACDVYGYGVIVWEMYSGQRPFGGLTHGQILHAITTGKMLSISPTCPSALKAFLQKCMAPKADDRPTFQQIIPMLDDLESELVGE